jgi:hypothetical protein
MKHEQDAIYDIDVLSDGKKIDGFVMACDVPFCEDSFIKMYHRHFPMIAKCHPKITIKYAQRDMR